MFGISCARYTSTARVYPYEALVIPNFLQPRVLS